MIRMNSIIVNIQKTLHFSVNQTKKFLESLEMKYQEFQFYEFIGLRSKMYSYLKDTDECGKTAKGQEEYHKERY